jgi:hypothetical protein
MDVHIYAGIQLVLDSLSFPHFLAPFHFQQTQISLSLNTVPEKKKLSDAGPLNHSIGLEEDRWKAKGVW